MATPTLHPKVQAWKDKWDKEFSDLQTKHRAAEQADWEANKDTYKAQGYTREEDPNNYWGSKWSYKGNSNNEGGNRGGNGEKEDKVDLSGLRLGSGNTSGGLNFSMLNLSTIGDRTNFTYDPYFGLFNQGSNPLTGPGITRETIVANRDKKETPFKYRKGSDSYYMLNSALLDFSKIFLEVNGRAYQHNNLEDKKEFDSWINQYYREVGKSNPFKNYYESITTPVTTNLSFLDSHKLNNPGMYKQGGTMNKVKYFQQGGQALNIEQQVIALVQAAMSGDQKATQQVNQIMEAAKAGNQQAALLAQMIKAVAQKMQGQATSAKWGSKLQYIKSLKFAKGGKHTCPVCEQLKVEMKKCGGKKAKKHYFGGWL